MAAVGPTYSGFKEIAGGLELYVGGALVVTFTSAKAVTFASGADVDMSSATSVALPQTNAIGGIAYTWPADDGESGEQLQTNGSGTLTWEASGV